MKKKLMLLVILVLLTILFACIYGIAEQKKQKGKKTSLYKTTITAVEKLNSNSNFLGHKLLETPPKDTNPSIQNYLSEDSEDSYSVGYYNDKYSIITISLISQQGNVYGITTKDSKDKIASQLSETGFVLDEASTEMIIYKDAHLQLQFHLDEDGTTIQEIVISVNDPLAPNVDY